MKNRPHEASWSHELIAGAAAYEVNRKPYPSPQILILCVYLSGGQGLRKSLCREWVPRQPRESKRALVSLPARVIFYCRILMLWNRSAFAGAFVDREVETRGVSALQFITFSRSSAHLQLDFIDKEKAKYQGERLCWNR